MAKILTLMLLITFVACCVQETRAQTTEFTFQGSLKDNATPANGHYDFEFELFDLVSAGSQIGATIPKNNVPVANGIFFVKLDFGAVFPGSDRFLEIRVRLAGQPSFTTLTPRQLVNSAPYSIKSLATDNAATATNAAQLAGVAASQYVVTTDPRMTDARSPTAGSSNYIQNQNAAPQASSNFNISGDGTLGGTFTGNIVRANTRFNLGGDSVLSNSGLQNLFAGVGAGSVTTGQFNAFFGHNAGNVNTTWKWGTGSSSAARAGSAASEPSMASNAGNAVWAISTDVPTTVPSPDRSGCSMTIADG